MRLLLILAYPLISFANPEGWISLYPDLFNEENIVQEKAKHELLKRKDIASELSRDLKNPELRDRAAEVIGKLNLTSLVDELIACAGNGDPFGACHRALLEFSDDESKSKVKAYAGRIVQSYEEKSDLDKGLALMFSTRHSTSLPVSFISHLMEQENPSLKELAMEHLEKGYEHSPYSKEQLRKISESIYRSFPYQNRLRFTQFLSRIGQLDQYRELCQKDKHPEVLRACTPEEGGI